MTRARELANFADNTAGLETLTVSDITDLSATATELNKLDGVTATTSELNVTDGVTVSTANINSAVNQITDSSTDLNVNSNTLVVDKLENRVGIGEASSIDAPLHVNAGAENNAIFVESTDANSFITFGDNNTSGVGHVFVGAIGDDLILGSGNGIRTTIDSSGNVGVGNNSPATTTNNRKNLQVGLGATVIGRTDDTQNFLSSNLTYNSGWKYIADTTASQIELGTNIEFHTAPSGTGGTAATLTERMRIDSSGNVVIGSNGADQSLTLHGTTSAPSTTLGDAIFDIRGSSSAHLLMGVTNASPWGAWIGTDSTAQPLILQGAGGNVGIGTTSPTQTLDVRGNAFFKTDSNSELKIADGGTNAVVVYAGSGDELYMGSNNQWQIRGSSNGQELYLGSSSSERARLMNNGSLYFKEVAGGRGDFTLIGSVSRENTGGRYYHIQISTQNGDMFWVEAVGYTYGGIIVYGIGGGYIYSSAGVAYSRGISGDITNVYFNSSNYAEIVVDSRHNGTTNCWGSIMLRGGTDTINTTNPLAIIQYTTSTSAGQIY